MTTITIENDDTLIMSKEEGDTWMEVTDTFLRMLLGCGYIFDKDKIMEAVDMAHHGGINE